MQFYIDHDWQENMATPRAKVGERAKTHLLILLCALWICVGLIGHAPWKPFESQSISIIQSLLDHPFWSASSWQSGHWIAPVSAGHPALESPPLFYWVASGCAYLLKPLLSTHDAARLSVGLWMLTALLMMGLSGRELWNKGVGRQTNFVFIGCLGLVITAHTMMPAVATLAGVSMAFYALSLVLRKPLRASLLLAAGLSIAFLTMGILPVAMISLSALILCLFPTRWQQPEVMRALIAGAMIALPIAGIWCWLCQQWAPTLWSVWWQTQWHIETPTKHWYFIRTLAWFAWPALPLALWGTWRFRNELLSVYRFQLCLVFFFVAFALTGFMGDRSEIHTPLLLIPLTALAAGSIETLKRGAAGALNWFGLILFGLLIGIAWLGWWAMLNGSPLKLYQRLSYLSGIHTMEFSLLYGMIAVAVTLIWFSAVLKSKHSNRSSATNWAIGMTAAWTVFMSLWLPILEAARSYQPMFTELKQHLPKQYQCINVRNFGSSQTDLLHYHAGIAPRYLHEKEDARCDLYLIADEPGSRLWLPTSQAWQEIWQGEHSRHGQESFRLLQKQHH